jgi:hypothetical protein
MDHLQILPMKTGIGYSVWGLGLMLLACSCGVRERNQEVIRQEEEMMQQAKITSQPVEPAKPVDTTSIFGSYVGQFEAKEFKDDRPYTFSNLITVFIDSMSDRLLFGHSVVAGTNTPFKGEYSQYGPGRYHAAVREPGNGKYDGEFRFDVDSGLKMLTGVWTANDTSLDVTERRFELRKRYFKYDPGAGLSEEFAHLPLSEFTTEYSSEEDEVGSDKAESTTEDVIKFNPSLTLLQTKDVENMKRGDLEVLRNTIYARHGYTFRNRNMRALFNNVEWYMPVSTDIRDDLTDIEKQNIALLKRYEEHAARYYDYFGR